MQNDSFQKLYIQVSLQQFTYCVKNQLSGEILHLKSFDLDPYKTIEQQLDVLFDKEEALTIGFQDVLVLHDNNLNTFVPTPLFNEAALGSYLQYNTKVFPTDFFDYDSINTAELENIYVPYVQFNNYFLDQFGSFTFQHVHTNLVQHLLHKSVANNNNELFVHITNKHFEIVLLKNRELQFFNSYEYQTAEDFIYYLLFVFEQLKLDPQEQLVQLLGIVNKESALYEIAYNFIKNVTIFNMQSTANALQVELTDLQQHYILLQA